jgi:hypothetical protein
MPPTVTDIGVTSKQVHEARKVRDADKAQPGLVPVASSGLLAVLGKRREP